MGPISVKQVKEIILVSDDVAASRRLYRDVLGLAMPEPADHLNLARIGSQYLGTAQRGVMVVEHREEVTSFLLVTMARRRPSSRRRRTGFFQPAIRERS